MPTERNKEGIKERRCKYENRVGKDSNRKQTKTERLKGKVEKI
jgi:hypothetical protein